MGKVVGLVELESGEVGAVGVYRLLQVRKELRSLPSDLLAENGAELD